MTRVLILIVKGFIHALIVGLNFDFHAHGHGVGVPAEAGQGHSGLLVPQDPDVYP